MALWAWAPAVLEDTDVESEEEAPVDQVLPGSVCSRLLPAPGSAMLLTHQKPPQVALPSRKVNSPERPTARDAPRGALSKRRRLRGKSRAQKARHFLPAPGQWLVATWRTPVALGAAYR